MKKGDFIIIGSVVSAFVLSVVMLLSFSKQGSQVVIKQNNQVIYKKSISQNQMVDTGTNKVIIQDGVVYMEHSNCKNQICKKTGQISKKGETIVCLPNKVIVEIE